MATNETTTATATTTAATTIIAQANEEPSNGDGETERIVTATDNSNAAGDDEELEEGELKDDDDDDDDDDELLEATQDKSSNNNNNNYSNNNNNDDTNNLGKETDNRHHDPHQSNQPQAPYQFAPYHTSYGNNNSNHNHYRYPPNDAPPPMMGPHPMQGPPPQPGPMYVRGGPGGVGPVQKARCRFYSKTSNKCTWGDHCRFEHRDDSPGPELDNRGPPPGMGPGSGRGGGPMNGPPIPAGMGGPAERVSGPQMAGPPYPYPGRHQPYPPPPPHGYMFDHYSHHHSTPPPLPAHQVPHWRQQHSPYPSQSSSHPAEPVSPAILPSSGGGGPPPTATSHGPPAGPPGSASTNSSQGPSGGGGAPSPSYQLSSSSSAVVYERKHRLAYELAPWNDRAVSGSGYPPHSRYDRGDPAAGYQSRGGFYRNHYAREPPPYGREPMPHMGGGPYPSYPSAYRGPPMGPAMHASQYKYMSSSQRSVLPDARRSRSNKRGHDEDESSWSDSGSEDSILGQASYSKSHANKMSKQQQQQSSSSVNPTSDEPLDQGSGTPPGEPLPGEPLTEDRERQEMLLNKLKEIEDLMAKKKGEQEDPL